MKFRTKRKHEEKNPWGKTWLEVKQQFVTTNGIGYFGGQFLNVGLISTL